MQGSGKQLSMLVRVAQPTSLLKRIAVTVATGLLLAASALPFIALFPEPPAFGRAAVGIVSAVVTLATLGKSFKGTGTRQAQILQLATLLCVTTIAATGLNILCAHVGAFTLPTIDLLPRLFALQGEDVSDAVQFEVWLEIWLVCAAVAVALARAYRGLAGCRPASMPAAPVAPWNAATVLLW